MAYCTPFGYRVVRRSAPAPAPAFFPSAMQADFSPLLRLFSDLDGLASSSRSARGSSARPFQPRFDVREEQDAYHLQGELPGIDQKDIDIEFTDPTTLVVRGRTVREHSSGNVSAQPEQDKAVEQQQESEPAPEVEQAQSDAASESGSNYHRPSVEEERDEDWTDAAPEANTPATTTVAATETAETKQPEQQQVAKQTEQQVQRPSGRYWVSERSVGQFQRTFSFNGQVDQDGVTASLKNGILSIVVPKLQTKLRKISVE